MRKCKPKRRHLHLVPRPVELDDEIPDWISSQEALDGIAGHLAEARDRLLAVRVQGLTAKTVWRLKDALDCAFFLASEIKVADLKVAEGGGR